jgi:hypothetical protein
MNERHRAFPSQQEVSMTYTNSIKQIVRAAAVLLVTISVANAADQSMQDKQDACMQRVEKKYNDRLTGCHRDYTAPSDVNKCIAKAAKIYATSLQMCTEIYATKPPANYGVGGPSAGGLEGWHPKGAKGKGLTSGQPGPVDGGSSDDNGDHPKHSTGTFNPGITGAPLTKGPGASGGIIQ